MRTMERSAKNIYAGIIRAGFDWIDKDEFMEALEAIIGKPYTVDDALTVPAWFMDTSKEGSINIDHLIDQFIDWS